MLDGKGELLAGDELAAALGAAEKEPIGGAVAGAVGASGFAEGLLHCAADAAKIALVVRQAGARDRDRTRKWCHALQRIVTSLSLARVVRASH